MNNDYYVYEWFRLDKNEPFYVGKGRRGRINCKYGRGKHFTNILKVTDVVNYKLHENLTEEEAYQIEAWYIDIYRNEYGFDLVNIADGGKGGNGLRGKENYFYGKRFIGELNPMYGKKRLDATGEKNPMRRKEVLEKFIGKKRPEHSERMRGENHPLFGKKHTEESKKKMSESSKMKPNKRSRAIICTTTNKKFDFIKEGAVYYNIDDSYLAKRIKKGLFAGKLEDGTKLEWAFYDEYIANTEVTKDIKTSLEP